MSRCYDNTCDRCGMGGRELYHNEASGLALCETCDNTPELRYLDSIDLPGETSPAEYDSIKEFLIGIGWVEGEKSTAAGRTLTFVFGAPDEWELCERAHEVALELNSRGISYHPDRTKIVRDRSIA